MGNNESAMESSRAERTWTCLTLNEVVVGSSVALRNYFTKYGGLNKDPR